MAMPVSTELKKYMEKICDQARAVNPRWAEVFHECFLNTLETTIERLEDGSTFVVTGDIPAMWLRDSTAQVRPPLFSASARDISSVVTSKNKPIFSFTRDSVCFISCALIASNHFLPLIC